METIVGKYFLHAFRTTAYSRVSSTKLILPSVGQTKHFSVCRPSGSRTSRSNHIKNEMSVGPNTPASLYRSAKAGNWRSNSLSLIHANAIRCPDNQYLGRRKHQDIIIRISCHSGRIRRFERMPHIPTEVHAEISQYFHDNHIIPGCQFTDYLHLPLPDKSMPDYSD